ncbi:intercellular adhesion molecule 5 [Puntigrus tetrazona]|uniref:intercellular adhesion molecule 5 n=1 Tax=Puntigrus tetrazona TaxID=1606681 RepID=UPI001C897DC8|nr:intercellular adhesion molecule 5 [Puntigrus tetrazona]
MLLLQPLIGLFLMSHGDACEILFSPFDVVVEYGASFSVNCSSSNTTHQTGFRWGFDDTVVNSEGISATMVVTDWEMNLTCYMNSTEMECSQDLPITIYKAPDSVSIITVDHSGPMMEGEEYELQCDVLGVAPVQYLTVKWYKGQTLLNQTTFNDNIKTPVNETATLLIRPDRADDGAQYKCVAELELGEEGPPPTESAFNAEVYYKPKYSISTETIIQENHCPIQIVPWRAVVKYGDRVSADCKTSVQHQGIGWEASEGAVPMIRDKSLITWTVSELTEWDIEPYCFINCKKGDKPHQCLVKLPVTVYKTPDSVSISTVNHSGPMMEGEEYELQCDVLGVAPVQYLTVKWYKGQTLLNQPTFNQTTFNNDTIRTPVNETATLLIRPDRADDGAQYKCVAELELGAEGPQPHPTISSDPLNITVHFASEFTFCSDWSPLTETSLDSYPSSSYSVVGNPKPDISWTHRSSSVNSSTILNKHDSGRYVIIASNYGGIDSCFVNITVEYPPNLNCNGSYEVKENTPFKWPCIADGCPKPQFFLYKNGKMLQHDFHPKWNDGGLYRLTALNKHGASESSFNLNVLHAPVFYDSQDKFIVEQHSNITLECPSTGNPEPEVWWSFKNKNISTGRRHINIERATSTNAGVYTCSASNEFGRIYKSFLVEIKDDITYYILIAVVVVSALFVLIFLAVLMWKRRKSRGWYEIQHEMRPLSNGDHK